MRRFVALPLMAILAFPLAAAEKKQKDKHSAKFGDLHVTATKVDDEQSAPHKGDHHRVMVFVKVENTGKDVVCASFKATLRTSFNLQYEAYLVGSMKAPKMSEMLPGESAEGSYEFNVKDGVQPLEMVLTLSRDTIRCGSKGAEPSFHDVFVPTDVRLDVHDLPGSQQ